MSSEHCSVECVTYLHRVLSATYTNNLASSKTMNCVPRSPLFLWLPYCQPPFSNSTSSISLRNAIQEGNFFVSVPKIYKRHTFKCKNIKLFVCLSACMYSCLYICSLTSDKTPLVAHSLNIRGSGGGVKVACVVGPFLQFFRLPPKLSHHSIWCDSDWLTWL